MKLLKMYNLCVDELASARSPPLSPQAIVKSKPLARSVGNINLSMRAYQYLITAQVSLPHTFKYCSFMRLAVSEAFKTYICIRKMIIDKVHHLLRFLTVSLSYSCSSVLFFSLLLISRGLEGLWVLSAQRYKAVLHSHHRGVIVFKSVLLFMSGSRAQRTR